MMKTLLVMSLLLIFSSCVMGESDRPYSPDLILTMEDHIAWLHGERFTLSSSQQDVWGAKDVKKYNHRGKLNKDNIALGVGRIIFKSEKQFLSEMLAFPFNKNTVVFDENTEFLIVGSYTVKNKHWWDRLDSYQSRILIVEDKNKERFVMYYFFLKSSDKPHLYDRNSERDR